MENQQIIIYQNESNASIQIKLENQSLWLSQVQMAELFEKDSDTIGLHLRNIYQSGELIELSTTEQSSVVRQEGQRQVRRKIKFYNLDAIISVGYRVNSRKGTQFRIWATQVLKEHLVNGYTLNQQRFEHNAAELEQAIALIKKTATSPERDMQSATGLVEIISRYTQTFLWLQRYDEGLLQEPTGQIGGVILETSQAMAALSQLKADLMQKQEATALFALPRGDGLSALLGNLQQTAFGEEVYASIESKAAHLLYFVVKNHPFVDGNKRSAAFLFVDFLYRNGRLFDERGEAVINDTGLAALTLLVAESDPTQKDVLIRLMMNLLAKQHKEEK
ncbi:RhuM family protein [Acinetobacter harbinensis]|uniref:RhuM family protein n=1 Tax=Acinetobacter harbinensis TaxID=1353941 RepID=UPI0028F11B14|nr:RhuM family protein [Acinetobacter harbinensis]